MKHSTLHLAEVLTLERQMLHAVVAWCEKHGDPSIVLTERKGHRAKNQTAVFPSGTFLLQEVEIREGTKLT